MASRVIHVIVQGDEWEPSTGCKETVGRLLAFGAELATPRIFHNCDRDECCPKCVLVFEELEF